MFFLATCLAAEAGLGLRVPPFKLPDDFLPSTFDFGDDLEPAIWQSLEGEEPAGDSGDITLHRQPLYRVMRSPDGHIPIPEYLTNIYSRCRLVKSIRDSLLDVDTEELKSRFVAPELKSYYPYITALPVLYITAGGHRMAKFEGIFQKFSPNMMKVHAVVPTGNHTLDMQQIEDLVDEPEKIISLTMNYTRVAWPKVLGCILSHLKAIRQAWIANMSVALIFEDDAVPMYPSWRTSLEEFVLTIPDDWQAVQLQWTVGLNQSSGKWNHTNQSRPWVEGRGWGTAAYMIHRRGMERLMHELWNKDTNRFTLSALASKCPMMSADDCLLGFSARPTTDPNYNRLKWYPGDTEALQKVYLATPMLFLHDSQMNPLHIRNYCQDIKENERLFQQYPPQPGSERLLLFITVNSTRQSSVAGLLPSVRHLQLAGYNIFLAYDEIDQKLSDPSSRKMQMLWRHWKNYSTSWSKHFDYIWAIDEDISLVDVDLMGGLRLFQESDASMAAPTLVDYSPSSEAPFRRFQMPKENCKVRYTDYVEAVAPIFKISAISTIFHYFKEEIDTPSMMGIDLAWCNLLTERMAAKDHRACALLDSFSLIHNSSYNLSYNLSYIPFVEEKRRAYLASNGTLLDTDGAKEFEEECVPSEAAAEAAAVAAAEAAEEAAAEAENVRVGPARQPLKAQRVPDHHQAPRAQQAKIAHRDVHTGPARRAPHAQPARAHHAQQAPKAKIAHRDLHAGPARRAPHAQPARAHPAQQAHKAHPK